MKTAMLHLRNWQTPFWRGKSSEPNPWFSGSTSWSSGGWKSKIYTFTISTPMSPWQQPPRGTRTWISRIVLAWTGGQVSCHFSKSQEMQPLHPKQTKLVGGWTNPFEKYARQIGSFPLVGVKMKKIFEHTTQQQKWMFFGGHPNDLNHVRIFPVDELQWKITTRYVRTNFLNSHTHVLSIFLSKGQGINLRKMYKGGVSSTSVTALYSKHSEKVEVARPNIDMVNYKVSTSHTRLINNNTTSNNNNNNKTKQQGQEQGVLVLCMLNYTCILLRFEVFFGPSQDFLLNYTIWEFPGFISP